MSKREEDNLLFEVGLIVVSCVFWYFIFWYFMLPDTPYTFKNHLGWRIMPGQFPYTSSTPFDELPARIQQEYLVGFLVFPFITVSINWIFRKIRNFFEYLFY
jgi:hypothetical protein